MLRPIVNFHSEPTGVVQPAVVSSVDPVTGKKTDVVSKPVEREICEISFPGNPNVGAFPANDIEPNMSAALGHPVTYAQAFGDRYAAFKNGDDPIPQNKDQHIAQLEAKVKQQGDLLTQHNIKVEKPKTDAQKEVEAKKEAEIKKEDKPAPFMAGIAKPTPIEPAHV